MRQILGSLRYALINFIASRPGMFLAYYRRHHRFSHLVVRPDSELVIEGYPRCANSFAVLAFETAQQRPIHIAHHLHALAQIELGVQYGLPVLVLIRDPLSAVASFVTRQPDVSVAQALSYYFAFYKGVKNHGQNILLAGFETITSDYASVIYALNRRFGSHFKPYKNSAKDDAEIFAKIDSLNLSHEGGQVRKLARPTAIKQVLLEQAKLRVESHPLAERACKLFDELTSECL